MDLFILGAAIFLLSIVNDRVAGVFLSEYALDASAPRSEAACGAMPMWKTRRRARKS